MSVVIKCFIALYDICTSLIDFPLNMSAVTLNRVTGLVVPRLYIYIGVIIFFHEGHFDLSWQVRHRNK